MPSQKRESIKDRAIRAKLAKYEFWHDLVFTMIRNVVSACAVGVLGLVIIGLKWQATSQTLERDWYIAAGVFLLASSFFLVAWPIWHSLFKWKVSAGADFRVTFVNVMGVLFVVTAIYMLATPIIDSSLQSAIENIKARPQLESKLLQLDGKLVEQEKKVTEILAIVSAEASKKRLKEQATK